MVKIWETGKGEDFTCECGAVYAITVRRFPADYGCSELSRFMLQ